MSKKTTERMSYFFGLFMAVLMISSLFLPALSRNQNQQATVELPTATVNPTPTSPPPLTDFSGITFNQDYLHPSGLFSVKVPSGWTPNSPINNTSQAQISFNNPNQLSLVETYVIKTDGEQTLDTISARFDQTTLGQSWSQYTTWNELARQRQDDKVIIDFELSRNSQQYLARHVAWTDGDWIYVVRTVAPQNARDLIFYMIDQMSTRITPYKQFDDVPMGWASFYDQQNKHILLHPQSWTLVDGGTGRPSSLTAEDGTSILITSQADDSITDEEAASAYVQGLRSGIEVSSVSAISRTGGDGFYVLYDYINPDGEHLNGAAVLLNGIDGLLHVANALLPVGGVDLSSTETAGDYTSVVQSLGTFSLLSDLNLFVAAIPATATPQPTVTAAPVEATAEATDMVEMTDEATDSVEATSEMEATESVEATPQMEVTAEATSETTPESTEESSS